MQVTRHEVIVHDDPTRIASDIVLAAMISTVAHRGTCRLVVSGGRTPGRFFAHLVAHLHLPWSRIQLFWADERFVPHDHPDSNFGSARPVLIERSGIPEQNVHPWPVGEDPESAAKEYARTMDRFAGSPPEFDVTILGLGTDGHTASLFPHSPALSIGGETVATREPGSGASRLSLTLAAINASRLVLFLVTGDEKRPALSALLDEDDMPVDLVPARGVTAKERLVIVTDVRI